MARKKGHIYYGFAIFGGLIACDSASIELKPCDPSPGPHPDLPVMTSISPESGPPGTTVILTGYNFDKIDERYEVAYSDFSSGCTYASLAGTVKSDTEIEVTIPEDATLSGYFYLLADQLTVARSSGQFNLEVELPATLHIQNQSQFPIVSVETGWMPILEAGARINVEATETFEVEAGPLHLELCVGDSGDNQAESWACETYDAQLDPGDELNITLNTIPAAYFLVGEWVATWEVEEGQVEEENLRIEADGYWELRHDGRVVESGSVLNTLWPPYQKTFEFALRSEDPLSQTTVPVRSFLLLSPRAQDRVTFYRAQ